MEGKIKIGSVGKSSENYMVNWDEGSHNNIISQIFLSHDSDGIFSIQFQFVLDDHKFILSKRYGRDYANKFDVIALDWPHEYITGISGEYSRYAGNIGIRSLKFATNSNEYGPFGSSTSKNETKFDFNLGKLSQFGGFFGTSDGKGLQRIGVYLQPSTAKPKTKPKTGTSNAEETNSNTVSG